MPLMIDCKGSFAIDCKENKTTSNFFLGGKNDKISLD
jgi:hypothetical protein